MISKWLRRIIREALRENDLRVFTRIGSSRDPTIYDCPGNPGTWWTNVTTGKTFVLKTVQSSWVEADKA